MKNIKLIVAVLLSCSILCTSCIGSFGLSKKVLNWNSTIGDKWVNELVFIAFCILPVYEITVLADAVVINSIEFWSGSNPVAANTEYNIQGEKGNYLVQTHENGYTITNEANQAVVELNFDRMDQSWSVTAAGETTKLLSFINDKEVEMYLPNGESMNVELSQAGVLAFKQLADNQLVAQK